MVNYNILICGVGGQGTLLASRVLGNYATLMNYDCKLSEVHGMAQRGGSVVTYVKMGEKVFSPLIADGDADVLIAFEQLEALRWSYCVKPVGSIIVNLQKIMPLPVIIGAAKYPENVLETLKNSERKIDAFDALTLAIQAGNSKAVNTVMIGRLTKILNLDKNIMLEALINSVPAKAKDINIKAFALGLAE